MRGKRGSAGYVCRGMQPGQVFAVLAAHQPLKPAIFLKLPEEAGPAVVVLVPHHRTGGKAEAGSLLPCSHAELHVFKRRCWEVGIKAQAACCSRWVAYESQLQSVLVAMRYTFVGRARQQF
jgi:hypothetical protein